MAAKLKRTITIFLGLLLAVMAIAGNPMEAYASTGQSAANESSIANEFAIGNEYALAAESDLYELYLYEPTMSIILKNKETGALIRSTLSQEENDGRNNNTWTAYMQSGIVITAIKGTTDTYQVDLVSCKNTLEYSYNDRGFSARIYFQEYQFGLTVNVTLEDGDLIVEVPEESIVEDSTGSYIGTVSLFPFLGYTYLDSQEGYMFIPDGNGALIYLDDKNGKYTTGFSQMIYGSDIGFRDAYTENFLYDYYSMVRDSQDVIMPVFGMIHSDDKQGYLAIVEEGDERASIEAHPNGVMVDYNRCFVKFLLRRTYVQPLNNSNSGTVPNVETDRTHSNLKVRYHMLSGDSADYSGMAVAYRNYLLDNSLLTLKDTSYKTRVDFLGTDREEFLVFTRAVTMTTTDQIRDIYSELQESGVESLLTVYKGWQKGGLYNIPITKYKADSSIGGTGALTDLIKDSAELNYEIYLFNDALRANQKTSNTTFSAVKRVNKRKLVRNTYSQVYQYFDYLLPEKTDAIVDQFVKSYRSQGVNNLALTEINNNLYSYYNNGKYYSRFDCAASYTNTVSKLSENTNLVLALPFANMWDYGKAFLDVPVESSNYMYVDEEIPFLSIVLKGIVPMYSDYVNFEANKQEFFLRMLEAGVYPSFYLTWKDSSELIYTNSSGLYSTRYETYRDTVIQYDREFRQVAEATEGAFIRKHEKLDNGVSIVTYDNGTTIYLNYSDNPETVNGYTIEGMSYKVGES